MEGPTYERAVGHDVERADPDKNDGGDDVDDESSESNVVN